MLSFIFTLEQKQFYYFGGIQTILSLEVIIFWCILAKLNG